MKYSIALVILLSCPLWVTAQTTVIATGNWDATSTWQSNDIANVVTDNVAFSAGNKTATVRTGFTYTVGNVVLASDGNITIDGTGVLNIGNSTNTRHLTGNATRAFSITGTLTIWGNVTLGDGASWISSGNVTIKGNLSMGNNSSIINSGNFNVNGSWTSGTGTSVTTSGPVDVDGPVTVGTGSTLIRSAPFTALSCSGPAAFCNNVLPIVLASFEGKASSDQNILSWVTTSEYNFDRFMIERSTDGKNFISLGELKGAGSNLHNVESSYSFQDEHPVNGSNYYRLKSVDHDGYFEYSSIINVTWQGPKHITLYPTRSSGSIINLLQNFYADERATVQVYDNVGVLLEEFSLQGEISHKLEFQNPLNQGNYFLRYVSTDLTEVIRFSVK